VGNLVSVTDADETAAKIKAAGGTVVVEPMDVMDLGRMAFFADPTGAVFGVWQPKAFTGADVVNEPGSLCWNEVLTRDIDADKVFYPAVFGWVAGRPSFAGAPDTYTVWELDGKPVGGMMQMTDDVIAAEVPPHWGVCFAVADCNGTVAKARELGASVTVEPVDMPIGRFAGLIDPQGASFTVMQPASPA
jgi:predicted enzyme related to lactoylglutathione lyase